MRLKKNVKVYLTIGIIILIIASLAAIKYFVQKLDAVPENDPNLVGNTSGNIYNGGYFAEADNIVFFSNPYDGGSLYSMSSMEDNVKKVAGGNISFINVAGKFVYYYSSTSGEQNGLGYVRNGRGFYRSSLDGKKTYSLAKTESDSMMLIGNHLYYTAFEEDPVNKDQALVSVHSVTTSNEDDHAIINEHVKLGGYDNGNIYYSGINKDHNLYKYNTGTKTSSLVFDQYVYMPVVSGSYVYFLDLTDDYKLKKYSLFDGNIETIVDERVDTYNIYDSIIYYQNVDPDNYALKRVYTDGTGLEVVKYGVYKNINITSKYVYFQEFNNDLPVYHTPTLGPVNVTTFDAAVNAVIKK